MSSCLLLFSVIFSLAATNSFAMMVSTDNVAREISGDAVSGFEFFTDVTDGSTTENNAAISFGDGEAVSGESTFANADNIDVDTTTEANSNFAVAAGNPAVAGRRFIVGTAKDSTIDEQITVTDNKASIVGSEVGGPSVAIAGNEAQIVNLDNSTFTQKNYAGDNLAINGDEGKAVGGLATSFGRVTDSFVQSDNTAANNTAVTKKGPAIAGTRSNFATVTDSTIDTTSDASYNQAFSKDGNAVAGSSTNFGSIEGTFPGGGVQVDINATASRNVAQAQNDGKAVAGVETNIASAERADIDIDAQATQNFATVLGESDRPRQAVAGFSANIGTLDDAPLTIDVTTSQNVAYNNHSDTRSNKANNAIAGADIIIRNITDSAVVISANSTFNNATAVDGTAIAGNRVLVVDSDDQSSVSLDLYAKNNDAYSTNGDAITDNVVSVGGDAPKYYAP